jgi:hypothetical protein
MRGCRWIAWVLLASSACATGIERAAVRHQARAAAFEAAGDAEAALREREAADDERSKLAWRAASEREVVPPMSAFYR